MNKYVAMARAVAWLHWLWIVVLLAGVPIQVFFSWYGPIQVGALVLTIAFQTYWKACPLASLEKGLLARSGTHKAYGGSFLGHHLTRWGIRLPVGTVRNTLRVMLAFAILLWVISYFA